MPVYVGSAARKDRINFWENNKKMWDKLDKKAKPLWPKAMH
jgi:hypothetical protein